MTTESSYDTFFYIIKRHKLDFEVLFSREGNWHYLPLRVVLNTHWMKRENICRNGKNSQNLFILYGWKGRIRTKKWSKFDSLVFLLNLYGNWFMCCNQIVDWLPNRTGARQLIY